MVSIQLLKLLADDIRYAWIMAVNSVKIDYETPRLRYELAHMGKPCTYDRYEYIRKGMV